LIGHPEELFLGECSVLVVLGIVVERINAHEAEIFIVVKFVGATSDE